MPLALGGFFALAVQGAFFSPAKIGINKELVGSKHLGFAAGIQQMTAMLAILSGQIFAGWLFDHRSTGHGGGRRIGLAGGPRSAGGSGGAFGAGLVIAWVIPRVPAQGGPELHGEAGGEPFHQSRGAVAGHPLRRASFGVAFFWGFAAFINLWSVKIAKGITGGGEGLRDDVLGFHGGGLAGHGGGFGFASFLLRKRIELGWVPAGVAILLTDRICHRVEPMRSCACSM